MARFIQLHYLTSYPAALLNRDDAGFAKRIPFGGVVRTRISSQCLKRHWRLFEGQHALSDLGVERSVRSRETFERLIVMPLVDKDRIPEEVARAVTRELMIKVLGEREDKGEDKPKGKARGKAKDTETGKNGGEDEKAGAGAKLHTGQVTVLGQPEIGYLLQEARAICQKERDPKKAAEEAKKHLTKDRIENLKQLRLAAGLDGALFGRMVTSDILARGDAAVHVAHAFTVHQEATETDYFSVVDDLVRERAEQGSGHIGTAELTSGLYYGYLVLDVPLLVSNLEGCEHKDWKAADRSLAAKVIQRLVHIVATATPGAKLGSTAPYALAHLLLAEAGDGQPRTLANAFLDPVPWRPGLLDHAYGALAGHVRELDRTYGDSPMRAVAALRPEALKQSLGEVRTLGQVASFCAEQVLAS